MPDLTNPLATALRRQIFEEKPPSAEAMDALCRLFELNGRLSSKDMAQAMRLLISGAPSATSRLKFLRRLSPDRVNGEMLATAAMTLRLMAPEIPYHSAMAFDCCGTGGDRLGLFNISSVAGLVIAAAGVPVAKHGNRAITSGCGSADLYEALGIPLQQEPGLAAEAIDKIGMAFLFAPYYHSATRNVQPLRLELRKQGIPTLFNLLGPLSNPAWPSHQLSGVFHVRYMRPMAEAFQALGCVKTWVVCGETESGEWMDEVSACGRTLILEVCGQTITERSLAPEDAGLKPIPSALLKGGGIEENRATAMRILEGESSPLQQAVCLNAGVSLYLTGKAESTRSGYLTALELLSSGRAKQFLEDWRAFLKR